MDKGALRYVSLDRFSFEMIRSKLGHEMRHGVDPERGEYFQEKHVRYVVTPDSKPVLPQG